ncbi:olfactory receptor 1019-like [Rhinatrema bivittatum]|uniref:olfactory receptor 1019-like n=1 Tax=Rhinatrema bivittatum TaxID=194408 RepID=UPI00112E2703|nr:olfactory receptor 1019-like [Rhinatrema bivittatum]
MEKNNNTRVTEFLILGFSAHSELHSLLFFGFLMLYLLTLMGNIVIIGVTCSNSHLHTPMYFFLSNLSFIDICYTSVTAPRLLTIFSEHNNIISFSACMTQLYFFMSFASTEYLLLTAMAYDRYVAICDPMHYTIIMNKRACILLASISWITGFLESAPIAACISRLQFCGSNEIDHFFCDIIPLLKLSCSETYTSQIVIFTDGAIVGLTSFLLTLTSYVYIISSILKIHSVEGRHKAFSTCSSHLTVVIIFYGTVICVYMRPKSEYSVDQSKVLSMLYVNVIPMLNPLIYSLRNKDVRGALRKLVRYLFPCKM